MVRTPCPNCQRSRHTSVSGSAPTPRTMSVQGYDPLSDSAQIGPPLVRRGAVGVLRCKCCPSADVLSRFTRDIWRVWHAYRRDARLRIPAPRDDAALERPSPERFGGDAL